MPKVRGDDDEVAASQRLEHKCPLYSVSRHLHEDPTVGIVDASTLVAAIDKHYSRPLPETDQLFPWLHGLHPSNISQRAFLDPQKRYRDRSGLTNYDLSFLTAAQDYKADPTLRLPEGVRGLIVLRVGDDDNEYGSLVGSVTPSEILAQKCQSHNQSDVEMSEVDDDYRSGGDQFESEFVLLDPPDGISLRNFHIQVAKWAVVSDIVLYYPNPRDRDLAKALALKVAAAQRQCKKDHPYIDNYRTFIADDTMENIIALAPHVVAVPPRSMGFDHEELQLKNWDSNFLFHERVEMTMMSSASPIDPSGHVWLGNSVDYETYADYFDYSGSSPEDGKLPTPPEEAQVRGAKVRNWATFVECFDGASMPSLDAIDSHIIEADQLSELQRKGKPADPAPLSIHFPCAGSLSVSTCTEQDFFIIVSICKLIYLRSRIDYHDGPAGVLLYCHDGYTETSLLALAYMVYSTGISVSEAWIQLHTRYGRPFFAFPVDVMLLLSLESLLHEYSPVLNPGKHRSNHGAICDKGDLHQLGTMDPFRTCEAWLSKLDGSLPSRILPHMYLGSLNHAENPAMLVKMGIRRILSVGEKLEWMKFADPEEEETDCDDPASSYTNGVRFRDPFEGITKVMYMDNIQDDGVDALMSSLTSCLDFIDEAYQMQEPVLVHCRVGVSRSATVCIAEVMKRLGVGLARAYLFVRVRRLNVIIQPNLRFMYELVKWEELHRRNGEGWLREVDWHILCREISAINKAYIG